MSNRLSFNWLNGFGKTLETRAGTKMALAYGVGYITDVLMPNIYRSTLSLSEELYRKDVIRSPISYQIGAVVVEYSLKHSNQKNNDEFLDGLIQNYIKTTKILAESDKINSDNCSVLTALGFDHYPEQRALYEAIPKPLQSEDSRIGVGLSTAIIDLSLDADPIATFEGVNSTKNV